MTIATKEKPRTADERNSKSKEITEEQIASRAYELWLKRDCEHGFDVEDWLKAEEELKQES